MMSFQFQNERLFLWKLVRSDVSSIFNANIQNACQICFHSTNLHFHFSVLVFIFVFILYAKSRRFRVGKFENWSLELRNRSNYEYYPSSNHQLHILTLHTLTSMQCVDDLYEVEMKVSIKSDKKLLKMQTLEFCISAAWMREDCV